ESLKMKKPMGQQFASFVALVAILVIVYLPTASATVLVQDDFEGTGTQQLLPQPPVSGVTGASVSGDWTQIAFDNTGSPPGDASITTSEHYSGNSSLLFTWLANLSGGIGIQKYPVNVSDFYLRFAVKWSPGFQFNPGASGGKKVWRT